MKRFFSALIPALFLSLGLAAFTAEAQEFQMHSNNAHIQIKHIMVSAVKANGLTETRPVTPVMTVINGGDVPYVCERAPKISDAVVAYFFDYPPQIGRDRKLQLDGMGAKIVPYVNRALGKIMVSEMILVEGGRKMAKGSMSKLPFARLGCGSVLEDYEKRMKELGGS